MQNENDAGNIYGGERPDVNISLTQEKYLLQTFPLIHKMIVRKLRWLHLDSVDDLKQRVFLKLWRWKTLKSNRDLSEDEWMKLANVSVRNEVAEFFRGIYTRRTIAFSQLNEMTKDKIEGADLAAGDLEGNSRAEVCSLLALIWKLSQTLTIRQKYTYFLQNSEFIIDFISCGCCSIKDLTVFFESTEKELQDIVEALPLSDERIGKLLEAKLGEKLTPNKIWEARSKAKAKIARRLREYISYEGLFDQRKN